MTWLRGRRHLASATLPALAVAVVACDPRLEPSIDTSPMMGLAQEESPSLVVRPDGAVVIIEPQLSAVVGYNSAGQPTWRHSLAAGERLIVAPRVAGNSVTFLRTQTRLIALGVNGELLWAHRLAEAADTNIAMPEPLPDSGLLLAAGTRTVHALNADGSQRWSYVLQAGERLVAPPRPGPNGDAILATNQGILRLDRNGELLWFRLRPVIAEP